MATQRPDRANLDKLGAANIGLRLVGTVADTVEAKVATGLAATGAHLLNGKGDMLACLAGKVNRLQTAMVEPRQLERLPTGEIEQCYPYQLDDLRRTMSSEICTGISMPFTPREMALALTDIGIMKLKERLRMGQEKATILRNYALEVMAESVRLREERI